MRQAENIQETKRLMEEIRTSNLTPYQKQVELLKVQLKVNKPVKKVRKRKHGTTRN